LRSDRRINQFSCIFDLVEEVPIFGKMLPIIDDFVFIDKIIGLEVGLWFRMSDEDDFVLLITLLHIKYFYKRC